MRKISKLFCSVLCVSLLLSMLPLQSFAAGAIDTERTSSLTVCYAHEEQPLPDAHFSLYLVAEVDANARFTPDKIFADYPVAFENMDQSRWAVLANTLQGYVEKDALTPDASGRTDADGHLIFPHLKPGLYLVLGARMTVGTTVYSAIPFLVCVPSADKDTDEWNYDLVTYPKTTAEELPPAPETMTAKVLKIWNDRGSEDRRPQQISVQLLCDGQPYSTVALSGDNNWSYTWNDLDKNHAWNVVEIAIENYTVEQTKDGVTFCLTNTYAGVPPAEIPTTSPGDRLPQTGQLWWPVPVLIGAGILLVIIALARRKQSDK